MESLSFASLSLASILAGLPTTDKNEPVSQSVISTHISPALAGSWVLQLPDTKDSIDGMSTLDTNVNSIADNKGQMRVKNLSSNTTSTTNTTTTTTISINDNTDYKSVSPIVDTINTHKNNPISTSVNFTPQNDCQETYTFAEDNKMWSVSGAEWTYGRYVVSHQEEGLPLIAINTIYDNNEVDCSGNRVDQSGEMMLAFVDYESDIPYMHWCEDKEGKACFMTFKKKLP